MRTGKRAKPEQTHSGRGFRRGLDIAIFVRNLPQRRENFRRMLKIPFKETVDLVVDASPSRFCLRILHPGERELVDI